MTNYLEAYGKGWRDAFEPKLQILINQFPDIIIHDIKRYYGVLRISAEYPLDKDTQFIVDCVLYKIERESATTCESCGVKALQKKEYLPEKKCLCWKCYALEVDAIMSSNTQTQ
jgi:hypothetical protein